MAPLIFGVSVALLSYASFAVQMYFRLNGNGEGET